MWWLRPAPVLGEDTFASRGELRSRLAIAGEMEIGQKQKEALRRPRQEAPAIVRLYQRRSQAPQYTGIGFLRRGEGIRAESGIS